MKPIELPVNDLKHALAGFAKVAPRRATLPVLASLKINRDQNGAITMQATDVESFATFRLPVEQPAEPAEFLVPIEPLAKAAKGTKDTVNLYQEDKDHIIIQTKLSNTHLEQKIATLEPKEWPEVPPMPSSAIPLDQTFRNTFREACECASQDPSRFVLNGVYLDVEDKKAHYVVATNGRIMFSANSFAFELKDSVIIPTRKFLYWNGWWNEGEAELVVGPPIKTGAGWLQLKAGQWTFITKQIEGNFPKWKQVVPTPKGHTVVIPPEEIPNVLEVITRLPGDYEPDYPITLDATGGKLLLEGRNKDQAKPSVVPVLLAKVTGNPEPVAVNRNYLEKALRFGLNEIEIVDSLTPFIIKSGGKKVVLAPLRIEGTSTSSGAAPAQIQATKPTPPSTTAEASAPATTTERKEEVKTTTPEIKQEPQEASESALKKVIIHVEQIKDTLKGVVGELNDLLGTLKQAEKEKKTADKEMDAIRATLKTIQNVRI